MNTVEVLSCNKSWYFDPRYQNISVLKLFKKMENYFDMPKIFACHEQGPVYIILVGFYRLKVVIRRTKKIGINLIP